MGRLLFIFGGVFFFASLFVTQSSFAGLYVSPMSVVLEGRDRFAKVILMNQGDKAQGYEIEWSNLHMVGEDGHYELREEKREYDLSDYLVFSPRRVTLEANSSQIIRVAVRRSEGMADGDYRAHLLLKSVPLETREGDVKGDGVVAGVSLIANYSLPIFLRQGEGEAVASIGDTEFYRDDIGRLFLHVNVMREQSDRSVIGHLFVYHDHEGGSDLVGEISNAYVFTEAAQRKFNILIKKELVGGGVLRFVLRSAIKGNDHVYAEKVVPIE